MTFPAVALSNPWSNVFVNAATMNTNTTVPLNQVQAVLAANGTGSVGHTQLSTNVTGIGGVTSTYLNISVYMVAGRKYLAIASLIGQQNTSTSVVNTDLAAPSGYATFSQFFGTAAAGITIYGTASVYYAPSTSGSYAFSCAATSSAGSLTIFASSYLSVLDLGTV